MNLLDKLLNLKNYFTGNKGDQADIGVIDNWIEEAERLMLLENLYKHDAIKYIVEIFKSEIEKIEESLKSLSSKELSDYERDRMIDRKNLAQKFLNIFIHNKDELAQLENLVDNNSKKN